MQSAVSSHGPCVSERGSQIPRIQTFAQAALAEQPSPSRLRQQKDDDTHFAGLPVAWQICTGEATQSASSPLSHGFQVVERGAHRDWMHTLTHWLLAVQAVWPSKPLHTLPVAQP